MTVRGSCTVALLGVHATGATISSRPMSMDNTIRFDGTDLPVGNELPLIAYLAKANQARAHWECWDEDEPCDSGGSCGECLVTVLSGENNLTPASQRERFVIAKINRSRFEGGLDESRSRLCCAFHCLGPAELEAVDVPRREMPMRQPVVVDDRMLLRGLIALFSSALSACIKEELLGCARRVVEVLGIEPADGAVPGFCGGDDELVEYCRIVCALQQAPAAQLERVAGLADYERLAAVTGWPLFVLPADGDRLLPRCEDALSRALATTATWSIAALVPAARAIAEQSEDVSLAGLAARAGDPMLMVLARELPRSSMHGWIDADEAIAMADEYDFDWQVTPEFAVSVSAFVETANALLRANLPAAIVDNVSAFFFARGVGGIGGQCIALGKRADAVHHWAISGPHAATRKPGPEVEEFVAAEWWSTERYRRELYPRGWMHPDAPSTRDRLPCHCGSGRRFENCHGLHR